MRRHEIFHQILRIQREGILHPSHALLPDHVVHLPPGRIRQHLVRLLDPLKLLPLHVGHPHAALGEFVRMHLDAPALVRRPDLLRVRGPGHAQDGVQLRLLHLLAPQTDLVPGAARGRLSRGVAGALAVHGRVHVHRVVAGIAQEGFAAAQQAGEVVTSHPGRASAMKKKERTGRTRGMMREMMRRLDVAALFDHCGENHCRHEVICDLSFDRYDKKYSFSILKRCRGGWRQITGQKQKRRRRRSQRKAQREGNELDERDR
mmetsp:Transcript_17335/g.39135  ORF Transcript_17335/g.39135 Transcript_17335/m.39135 type:complete len:261 (+) Transcript_17335:2592-3374(+)